MKIKSLFIYLGLASIMLWFAACSSIKPAAGKSASNLYESFYVGEEGTQYFIKPISFESENNSLEADFTFRYKNEVKDSATVNFSVYSVQVLKQIDHITLTNSKISVATKSVELLFNERKQELFTNRFSCQLPLSIVKQLFEKERWQIKLVSGNQEITFESTKKAEKKISKIDHQLFSIM